jgi:GTP-binding protein HflX
MIEISPPTDRVVLVAAPRRGTADERHAEEHLEELSRLADTAGAAVVTSLIQRVNRPSPRHYIGAGKLEELQNLVAQHEANLVIFDEELTPAQGKNLEQALDARVMDRAELILDIFATRARTNEARMQVELAQLEYLLPRLARMWVHLSRIRGGIGLRGPGETQIETDRRMIRTKIAKLKKKLEKVAKHREVIRQGRDRRDMLTAALVGYTNAGKSSVLRALTGADAFIEDRLFATLDTLTREVHLDGQGKARLVDTVGFIRKLPHHLVASFRATLEEAVHADVLLHVIDASHPDWEEHVEVVDVVLRDVGVIDIPVVHVFNKMDQVADPEAFRERLAGDPDSVCVSAVTEDLAELTNRLQLLVAARAGRGYARAGLGGNSA